MPYKIIDMHTHTDNSPDGVHSAMYMCEQAYIKGIRALAITDHVEIDFFQEKNYDISAFQSFFEAKKAKYAFTGEMLVCTGVELGQPLYDTEKAEKLLSKLPYDFVISSVHNLKGMQDFCRLDYSKYDIDDLLKRYFDEIIKLCKWGKFDSLAHLTYPLRYIVGEHSINVDIERYIPQIETALKALIENQKALEINTSGLRQKLGTTMPDENILKLYRSLGGDMITIGSDAHYAEDLGKGIDEGMILAKKCGFTSTTIFLDRTPIQISIDEELKI